MEQTIKKIKRTLTFQHIIWPRCYKSPGHADVTIEIAYSQKGPCLSIMAEAYERYARQPFAAGQCLDVLMASSLRDDALFREIYGYWKVYHLNDMHAGTPKQERCIKEGLASGELASYDYDRIRHYLDEHGLLMDGDYEYGTMWLYEPIPPKTLKRLEAIAHGSTT